jgi:membrane protein DedA with SNARE-associated domain
MTETVPRGRRLETRGRAVRRVLIGLAIVRTALFGLALLLAPWLYEEHAAVLVLLRPTKEVLLFAGFMTRRHDLSAPVVLAAALPLMLVGVWLFFWLGRAYEEEAGEIELPGVAGRLLPKGRIDHFRTALEDRGVWVVFLGRLAVMPSSAIAAAAGSSGVSWRRFVVADTAGGLLSLAALVTAGYVLGETYEAAGGWFTAAGAVVLVALAVLLGRALSRGSSASTGGTATRNARRRLASTSSVGPS